MPFPNLVLSSGRTNLSQATGQPDNGINEFLHGWTVPVALITEDAIELTYAILGPSVSAVVAETPVLSADGLSLRINFTQSGTDDVEITARLQHSTNL